MMARLRLRGLQASLAGHELLERRFFLFNMQVKPGIHLNPALFHKSLSPLPAETVTEKRHCNAFQETELESVLRDADIESLVGTGMQSNYCVDTFVRAAKERGFAICLVSDGHTTFDTPILTATQIIAHHNHTLEDSFASLIRADDVCFSE